MDTSSGQRPPSLSRGAHLSPEDGTCLMEAVAMAADLPFSDAPACIPALLAHLARLANDASSESGRQPLSTLIPALVATRTDDSRQAARVAAHVALACTTFGLAQRPTLLLAWLHRRAAREVQLEGPERSAAGRPLAAAHASRRARIRRRLFVSGPGARAVEAAVDTCLRLPLRERDAALSALLQASLSAATPRAATGSAVANQRMN